VMSSTTSVMTLSRCKGIASHCQHKKSRQDHSWRLFLLESFGYDASFSL
jgi:hypothetical protein